MILRIVIVPKRFGLQIFTNFIYCKYDIFRFIKKILIQGIFTVLSSVFYTITISWGFLEDNYLPNVVCTSFIFFANLFQELILYRLGKAFLMSLASKRKG